MLGRTIGNRNNKKQGRGYAFLHHAVDDHSRLAYSEILTDERQETAAGFWERANAFFADAGIIVHEVLTDNGSCYRSGAFARALGDGVKHRFTRPYRPQTNGKVERFNRTLSEEWAYAVTYDGSSQLRVWWAARRCLGRGRGLPRMGVLTLPTGKTSTCLTLHSPALT